jgi:hypothetical protein
MTMAIDDEKFFAWLDGELDPAEAAAVAAEVAADPRLTRMAEQHRAFGNRLRAAFDPVLADSVPERLRDAAKRPSAAVIDIGSRRRDRSGRAGLVPLPQWAAMAATLVVGILVGSTLLGERGASPVEIRGNKIYAAAQLDDALERQLASAGPAAGVRIGVTFRDRDGAICRSFTDARSTGLACRDGDDWRVKALLAAPEGQSSDHRMAAGADPALADLIEATMTGEAFDAGQEQSAKARGWR